MDQMASSVVDWDFGQMEAVPVPVNTLRLHCPKVATAMPTRKRILVTVWSMAATHKRWPTYELPHQAAARAGSILSKYLLMSNSDIALALLVSRVFSTKS